MPWLLSLWPAQFVLGFHTAQQSLSTNSEATHGAEKWVERHGRTESSDLETGQIRQCVATSLQCVGNNFEETGQHSALPCGTRIPRRCHAAVAEVSRSTLVPHDGGGCSHGRALWTCSLKTITAKSRTQ